MPETVNAPPQNEQAPSPAATSTDPGARQQVHAVQFPEAPADGHAVGGNQLDILLDMEVPIAVVLGTTQIPVRRLLQLGPGSVLKLDKSIEAPADLFLKDARFAEADVVVVDNQFAVRIKQILGAGAPTNSTGA
jgi:flagellar motor switch protein FliN/FliY